MVRKIVVLALLAFALIWLACSKDNKPAAVTSGSIEGRVTADGVGVPGATINVSAYLVTDGGAKTDGAFGTAGSASDGDYHVDVLPGQYSIQYSAFYNSESLRGLRYPVTVNSGTATIVNIDLKDPVPANLILSEYNARVLLQWQGGYGSTAHNIYRSTAETDDYQLMTQVSYGYGPSITYDSPPAVHAYKYKVTAVSDIGESGPSNEAQIDFTGVIPAPVDLTVRDQINYVRLNWYGGNYAVQYKIYRSSQQGSWSLLSTGANNFYDDVPPSYDIYNYRVTALSSYGTESVPTPTVTVNYDGRLDAPRSITIVDRGSSLYLTWESDNFARLFNIYSSSHADRGFTKIDSTAYNYYQSHPVSNGEWFYKVSVIGPNGLESDFSSMVGCVFDGRLDPPNNLTAFDAGLQTVLSWDAITWAGAYLLYRSDDGGTTYHQISRISSNNTRYYDTPPSAGSYYYKISTETYDGVEGLLSDAAMTNFTDNLFAPNNPRAENDGMSVTFYWDSVPGATGYTIYRASQPTGDYIEIEDASTSTFYSDIPMLAGAYYYRVQAFDNHNHRSPMSFYAYVYFTARPLAPTNINLVDQGNNVWMTWDTFGYADSCKVYRSTSSSGPFFTQFWTSSGGGVDWPPSSGHYYYKVQAIYRGITSDLSEVAHVYFSGRLDPPTGLQGYDVGSSVHLNWNAIDIATSYDVYRGSDGDNMTLNQTVYTNSATDMPLNSGTYYYAVLARTRGGLPSPLCPPVMVVFNP